MFALYHGSYQAATFRDLNDHSSHGDISNRDITQSGFKKLAEPEKMKSGSAYRRALHDLCCDIFESGGHEVIFSMFTHDHMKIIKQKCLDALTNILCVPVIEEYVLKVSFK